MNARIVEPIVAVPLSNAVIAERLEDVANLLRRWVATRSGARR